VNRKPCVFPFKYKGTVYEGCTTDHSENNEPWCATAVDPETGEALSGFWEDCGNGCPGTKYPCGLFNLDGKCVNETFRARIEAERDIHIDPVSKEPNFEFRDGVKDYKNDGSVVAPKCSTVQPTIEGNGPINGNENVVGECSCAEKCMKLDHRGPDEHGWCFLGSIRDPQEPTKYCYKDTVWSPTAGRFWSRDACTALAANSPVPPPPPPFMPDGVFTPNNPDPDYDIPVVSLDDEVLDPIEPLPPLEPVSITPIPPTPEPIHFAPIEPEEQQAE